MPILLLAIIILAFLCAMLFVMGLAAPSSDRSLLSRRMEAIARGGAEDGAAASLADAQLEGSFADRIGRPALRRLSLLANRLAPAGATDAVRVLLNRAGNPPGLGVAEFMGLRVLSVLVFFGLSLFIADHFADTPLLKVCLFAFGVIVGFVLPSALLQQQIAARQLKMRKSLPDTIDLLIVSVEAGMSFDGAVAKVVDKVRGPLSDEFGRTLQEMRLGKTRGQALRDMAARVDVPELTTFVAAIYQADQLGVSIANVLRIQSQTIRVARTQHVREMAAKLPVLMLFPLVFFIFPAVFIVLLGPGFISIMKAFANM